MQGKNETEKTPEEQANAVLNDIIKALAEAPSVGAKEQEERKKLPPDEIQKKQAQDEIMQVARSAENISKNATDKEGPNTETKEGMLKILSGLKTQLETKEKNSADEAEKKEIQTALAKVNKAEAYFQDEANFNNYKKERVKPETDDKKDNKTPPKKDKSLSKGWNIAESNIFAAILNGMTKRSYKDIYNGAKNYVKESIQNVEDTAQSVKKGAGKLLDAGKWVKDKITGNKKTPESNSSNNPGTNTGTNTNTPPLNPDNTTPPPRANPTNTTLPQSEIPKNSPTGSNQPPTPAATQGATQGTTNTNQGLAAPASTATNAATPPMVTPAPQKNQKPTDPAAEVQNKNELS